jgi:hypothetical protein
LTSGDLGLRGRGRREKALRRADMMRKAIGTNTVGRRTESAVGLSPFPIPARHAQPYFSSDRSPGYGPPTYPTLLLPLSLAEDSV